MLELLLFYMKKKCVSLSDIKVLRIIILNSEELEFTEMLKNVHYNLEKSNNSPEKLLDLNQESIDKIGEGEFDLRSCRSNFENSNVERWTYW